MWWSLLTVQALSVGPALGGWLTDGFSWELIFYVQIMAAILLVAFFAQQMGTGEQLVLPLAWDTPYHILRSIVSVGMLVFTLLFIVRHCVLVVCATADEV